MKAWFWTSEAGKINLAVTYGSKVIELAKGKNAIERALSEELISTRHALKAAVLAGEIDPQIEASSGAMRTAFGK